MGNEQTPGVRMDADYIDARFVRVNRRPFRTPHPQPLTPRAHLRIATVYPVTGYSASYGRHSPFGLPLPGTPPRSYGVPGYGLICVLRTPHPFWLGSAGHTSAELRCVRLRDILRPSDAGLFEPVEDGVVDLGADCGAREYEVVEAFGDGYLCHIVAEASAGLGDEVYV